MQNLYVTLTTNDIFVKAYNKNETDYADWAAINLWFSTHGPNTDYFSIPQTWKTYITVKNDTINNI